MAPGRKLKYFGPILSKLNGIGVLYSIPDLCVVCCWLHLTDNRTAPAVVRYLGDSGRSLLRSRCLSKSQGLTISSILKPVRLAGDAGDTWRQSMNVAPDPFVYHPKLRDKVFEPLKPFFRAFTTMIWPFD